MLHFLLTLTPDNRIRKSIFQLFIPKYQLRGRKIKQYVSYSIIFHNMQRSALNNT